MRKITPEDIENYIKEEIYINPIPELTLCVLVLKNGFVVLGKSAPADPTNFDEELGKKIARANAINEVWPLMGYVLKSKINGMSGLID